MVREKGRDEPDTEAPGSGTDPRGFSETGSGKASREIGRAHV